LSTACLTCTVWDDKPSVPEKPIKWVELKTSASINSDKEMLKYERKLLKFWIQSFLLGVPKIVVGFRSPNGILERLEHIETQAIPSLVQRKGHKSWDGNTCINFTAAFLSCQSHSSLHCSLLMSFRAQGHGYRRGSVAHQERRSFSANRGLQGCRERTRWDTHRGVFEVAQ
jgi:hypothetical protein